MKTHNKMYSPETTDVSCPSCGSVRIESRTETEPFTYGVGDKALELRASIPVRKCVDCGFEFTDDAAETLRHEAVCRHLGVLTPAEISYIREKRGLSRADFAKLTRIGEASLHRWENGLLIQNAAMDSYLRLLAHDENCKRLKSKSSPMRLQAANPGQQHVDTSEVHGQEFGAKQSNVLPFRVLHVTEKEQREASGFELRRYLV